MGGWSAAAIEGD